LIVAVSLIVLRSRPARAQNENPRVSVQLDACVHVDRQLFQQVLDAELELAVDYSGEPAASDSQPSLLKSARCSRACTPYSIAWTWTAA
jgi:hypothetical protein